MTYHPYIQIFLFFVAGLAGLGLISLGTRLLSEGLQLMVGARVRRIINWLDQNDSIASVVGALTSLMIQSRISASVMSVSYAGSGLMNQRQMIFFLLGATFGTFLTPWIFLLDSFRLDLYFLALGVLPMMHARWDQLAGLGRAVFAVGLMLLGFDVVAFGAAQPDIVAAWFKWLFGLLPEGPIGFAMLVTCVLPFCMIVRSTVALIGLVMALVFAGLVDTRPAVIMAIGFNLGAVIPALMASRKSNLTSRKGVGFFVLIYLLSIFIMGALFDLYWPQLELWTNRLGVMSQAASLNVGPTLAVPTTHVVVNVLAMAIGFCLSPFAERITSMLFGKPKKKQTQHLKYFGRPSQFAPSLALEQASQEVKKMAALVHTTLHMTQDTLLKASTESESRALKYEGITDSILQELTVFLAKVMQVNLSKTQSFESACLLHFATELEKIADNCQDILEQKKRYEFSEDLKQDLAKYFAAAVDCFEHVFPMLTDHFNIRQESMDSFLEDMQSYVEDSSQVYDELLLQGLTSHKDYNQAIPVFNSIRKIVENTHSIVDLRQRFLLPESDLAKA
ncbi:MAG: Na/Pi symporter [Pseudomonadota bacterium]